MRDIKTAKGLATDENWIAVPVVMVEGDGGADAIPPDASQAEGEKVVQSWERVAVLEVEPVTEVYFGFMVGEHVRLMNVPVELADGRFGVRVGDGEVRFFVMAKDMRTRVKLSVVEVTKLDEARYADLPLY